ncbi:hypothetical protein DPQ33_02275 [Oceanidesulfovibrio indonesiensis]|uniref:Acyl-protein synthetase LuxE domain-containing protein n=1 Tax=Oceanidesulfovibrio indonesiensis TaxID=54767 RepID=A0A7M3MIC3_9BACT|nr:hypothetical protein [Oceanidesulfovibrio indonesiensis]TVM19207.1 hypothetical protein DPQ33_02275 [Oceanidesulfovibrio indonesiensis]
MDKHSIIQRIRRFIADETTDDFDALARAICRWQYANLPTLAAFWDSLGWSPDSIDTYADIPAVGLGVFKKFEFFAGGDVVKTFRTSGTSGKGRGASIFDAADLELMNASILANAAQHFFPDGQKTRFFMLVPPPAMAPDVIMAYGMDHISRTWALAEPFCAVGPGRLLLDEGIQRLRQWADENVPVTIIGGSFGIVNFVEGLGKDNAVALPAGSRILDAGGFKGRSRELTRGEFVRICADFFAIPKDMCINLYGLTELASQFYSRGLQPKTPAHWTRVRVCNPLTLEETSPGGQGVPVLYDLANVARPMAILTDDLAQACDDFCFEIIGRASGSAPRGCSLNLEDVR